MVRKFNICFLIYRDLFADLIKVDCQKETENFKQFSLSLQKCKKHHGEEQELQLNYPKASGGPQLPNPAMYKVWWKRLVLVINTNSPQELCKGETYYLIA